MSKMHVRVRVGRESYAFPIDGVLEVAEAEEITPVPGAARGVLGVRNLRGQVLPVIDLGRVLGVGGDDRPSRLVVVEHRGSTAAVAVDELQDVEPLPDLSGDHESRYMLGATLVDGTLVGVVDVAELMASVSTLKDER